MNSSSAPMHQDPATTLQVKTENLAALGQRVEVPHYDRNELLSGIVHMSVGGFHRAHQAVYIDELLSLQPDDWMITGIGLMPQDDKHCAALKEQDTLYTVLERTAEHDTARVAGSMKDIIHAPTQTQAVFNELLSPNIKILSLTITEKGYCYNENGDLDENNQMIQHDVQNLNAPKTALGYATKALMDRKNAGMPAFTVMSCDNLPGNGHLTKKILTSFMSLVDKDLQKWTEDNVSFPNAMVDRITPITTDSVITRLHDNFKIDDKWPVICEDYKQWVLEDDFCNGRPELENVGVQMVSDVEPYEKMKVRLLNGSHSALSYVSYLMGYRDVDLAMNDPLISSFVRKYMDEDVTAAIPSVPGIDLDNYKDTLITRFANPGIRDQVQRLAEDGSQKIPNAIIPCIKHQLQNGGSVKWMAFAFAAWFKYLTGVDENLEAITIKDPLASELQNKARLEENSPLHLLSMKSVFDDLSTKAPFVQEVSKAMTLIGEEGTREALSIYLSA